MNTEKAKAAWWPAVDNPMAAKMIAEMIGTFSMIAVGGSSILLAERFPALFPSFGIAVAWGSIIALMILALGNLSGAHFNPAVTLAFAAMKRFPSAQVPLYWFSQCAGGLAAAGFLVVLRKI